MSGQEPLEKPKVFISYGRENLQEAKRLYDDLTLMGCAPWLAVESLVPGTKWKPAVSKAIRDSRYFGVLPINESS